MTLIYLKLFLTFIVIELGFEHKKALSRIITIVKNMNYALALYEEFKLETELLMKKFLIQVVMKKIYLA